MTLAGTGSGSSSAFPDASNTGVPAGTTLATVTDGMSGTGWSASANDAGGVDVEINADGAILDSLLINGKVHNPSSHSFTASKCKVTGKGESTWGLVLGAGSTLEDCTLDGRVFDAPVGPAVQKSYAAAFWSGGSDAGNTVLRCNIQGWTQCRLDGGTTMKDCYIHDMVLFTDSVYRYSTGESTTGEHSSCSFVSTGHNVVFNHNTFASGDSANIFVQDFGQTEEGIGDVTWEYNHFVCVSSGATDYGIGCENKDIGSKGFQSTIVVKSNTFTKGLWAVAPAELPTGATSDGLNVYDDGSSCEDDFLYKDVIF